MVNLSDIGAEDLMPPPVYHNLTALWGSYKPKYIAAADKKTRTSSAIIERNQARKVYEAEIRRVVKTYLINNPNVTDAQRNDMGLPIHKTTRTPSQVAKTFPWVEVLTYMIRHLILNYGASSTERAKPEGQIGVEVLWVISHEKPSGIEQLIHSVFDTRSPIDLEFSEEDRGKTVWFVIRWENTRGEKGPWSPMYSAIIP
jgi:hypothetical protein